MHAPDVSGTDVANGSPVTICPTETPCINVQPIRNSIIRIDNWMAWEWDVALDDWVVGLDNGIRFGRFLCILFPTRLEHLQHLQFL